MNLVDAIRKAAQQPRPSQTEAPPVSQPPSGRQGADESEPTPDCQTVQTVRFEVQLTNQQLYDLLRWLARTLHPVMTLQEAAHYLRLRKSELETLAEQGAIPAFKVDGRWRFLKNALDEWMMVQKASSFDTQENKEESHAA
jgi:excisionase family DNA binding protein